MTEPLFRFLTLRPPQAQDPANGSINLIQASDFQTALAEAAASSNPRPALVAASQAFITSKKFIPSASVTDFQKKVNVLSATFDKLEAAGILDLKAVESAVQQVFHQTPAELVKSAEFVALSAGLKDSITAIKYVQEEHHRPIAELTDQLRDLELVQKAADSAPAPATPRLTKRLVSDIEAEATSTDWNDHQHYGLNDQVIYDDSRYECIAPHLSHPRLTPTDTPSLWAAVDEPDTKATASFTTAGAEAFTDNVLSWKVDQNYKVGDRVKYQGIIYACLQAHKSQTDWTPSLTPALWKPLEAAPPEPPAVLVPVYRKRSLLLPVESNLRSILEASIEERKKAEEERRKRAEEDEKEADQLLKTLADLKTAISELTKLSPDHLEVKAQSAKPAIDVLEKFGRTQFLSNQLDFRGSLQRVALDRVVPTSPTGTGTGQPFTQLAADPAPVPINTEPTGAFTLAKDLLSSATVLKPKGAWAPIPADERIPRLRSSALSALGPTTVKILQERGIDINKQPVNSVVKRLREEITVVLEKLKVLAPTSDNLSYTRFGAAFVVTRTPIISRATSILYANFTSRLSPALPALALDGRVPHTKGKVIPAGVADLLIVKQTLKGYQAADIAHVENILKGENKQRKHTKTTKTETSIFSESETTSNEEHELTSTDRFEMSKEAANTLKEDQSLKAGLKVSAKYGPAVEIEASAEGSISRNKEEVTKSATKFSQDVTDRTVKKITERVLQRQSTVTINEVVEVNEHGINNENGTGHISGVYQWLNKRYEAQVFNYGLRMMFEFMIPEPAAFLTYALSTTVNSAEAGLLLEKPSPFELKPADITEEAIGPLIAKYQALDVLPPPEDYITVSDQAKVGGGDVNTNYDHGAIISIPAGYQAIYATVSSVKNIWEKANVCLDIMVGGETVRFGDLGLDSWGTSLLNNVDGGSIAAGGSIAWAFNTFGIPDCVVSVEILCRVTDRRKQQWQAETHAKLLAAYKARLSEYEEKLARLKLETGVNIQGTNPAANLITIKAELKKSCISVLTAQHYDLFNSISTNPKHGYPEVNLYQAEAEGSYVRFFEQAFEWDQIMYITYPYFWGRQDTWIKKMTFNDTDPVFDEFLKAGFARVVVPARPGFEGAIDHFMQLGEIWNGGPLPSITSKLYVPIADEVSERARKPQGEIPQGEPWEVTIPTTLVKLKADDSLPTF